MLKDEIRQKLIGATELEKYIIARWTYAIGQEYLDDTEYRTLEDHIRDNNISDLVYKSWSSDICPSDVLRKFGLDELIKQNFMVQGVAESIPNCPTTNELRGYLLSRPNLGNCRLSYKLDGWNIHCHFLDGKFQSAHTRGRGARAQDVDIMKHLVHDINIMGHVEITGELIIPNSKWNEYKMMTGNSSQRSSVSSCIANNDFEFVKWVCYKIDGEQVPHQDMYKTIEELGYETPYHINFPGEGVTVEKIQELLKGFDLSTYEYPTDGVVFDCDHFQIALRLNEYSESTNIGKIVGYKEEYGAYGTSFTVQIEPLVVNGIRRTNIPIQNIGNIEQNDLRVGYPICFNIRSGVAPVFNEIAEKELLDKLRANGTINKDGIMNEKWFEYIYNKNSSRQDFEVENEEESNENNVDDGMLKLSNEVINLF